MRGKNGEYTKTASIATQLFEGADCYIESVTLLIQPIWIVA